ncbi:MAG: hypothetical protein ACD_3C00086G0027 [uncultured bacterium (gcode 4)]|uniref:Uncharacterized protein n=1 Tax=uncultured bacterium (gcode 4) TaxID=1234023 RepID=K2FZ28_9BACT|nr:MAG: hypothetical protein ACD_3C00086G0027 [uncultured bacterium (gcode 4)]
MNNKLYHSSLIKLIPIEYNIACKYLAIRTRNIGNLQLETTTNNFYSQAWLSTYQCFQNITGLKPYLTDRLQYFLIQSELLGNTIAIAGEGVVVSNQKALHSIVSRNNTVALYKAMNWDVILFDQQFTYKWLLKPDGIVLKNDRLVVFQETDCASQRVRVIANKASIYLKFITEMINEWYSAKDIRIVFFTTNIKRIKMLLNLWVFSKLQTLWVIKFAINNLN